MFIPSYFKPSQGVTVSSHDRKALFHGKRRQIKYQQHGQVSDDTVQAVVAALQEQQKRNDTA